MVWYKQRVISLFISSNWYVDINMTEGRYQAEIGVMSTSGDYWELWLVNLADGKCVKLISRTLYNSL